MLHHEGRPERKNRNKTSCFLRDGDCACLCNQLYQVPASSDGRQHYAVLDVLHLPHRLLVRPSRRPHGSRCLRHSADGCGSVYHQRTADALRLYFRLRGTGTFRCFLKCKAWPGQGISARRGRKICFQLPVRPDFLRSVRAGRHAPGCILCFL